MGFKLFHGLLAISIIPKSYHTVLSTRNNVIWLVAIEIKVANPLRVSFWNAVGLPIVHYNKLTASPTSTHKSKGTLIALTIIHTQKQTAQVPARRSQEQVCACVCIRARSTQLNVSQNFELRCQLQQQLAV